MKTLLLVVFTVPPTPGSSPGRAWQIARHLPAHGWEAAILTPRHPLRRVVTEKTREHRHYPIPLRRVAHPGGFSFWLQETTYEDLLFSRRRPPSIDENEPALPGLYGKRSPDPEEIALEEPPSLGPGPRRIAAWFRCNPDARAGWIPAGLAGARAVCDTCKPDAVYSVSPPVTAHRIAMRAAENLRIPWIADIREPWKGMAPPFIDAIRRRRILRCALRLSLPPSFDEADLLGHDPRPWRPSGPFVLVHAGPTAIRGRDATPVLDAIRHLLDSGAVSRDALRVRFVGARDPRLAPAIGARALAGVVTLEPTVPWEVSLETQADADALLIVLGPGDSTRIPDRALEAISAHRFVLALGSDPDTPVGRMLRASGLGVLSTDSASLAAVIVDRVGTNPGLDSARGGEAVEPYRASRVVAGMIERLEGSRIG